MGCHVRAEQSREGAPVCVCVPLSITIGVWWSARDATDEEEEEDEEDEEEEDEEDECCARDSGCATACVRSANACRCIGGGGGGGCWCCMTLAMDIC